ncbi:MAG TPA: hypothetical protein VGI79_21025 [Caulobacteraceae bacterium]
MADGLAYELDPRLAGSMVTVDGFDTRECRLADGREEMPFGVMMGIEPAPADINGEGVDLTHLQATK